MSLILALLLHPLETSLVLTKLDKIHFKGKILKQKIMINVYYFRVRRDVLEGTWDEVVFYADENEHISNRTVKRQADFPDLDINKDSQK